VRVGIFYNSISNPSKFPHKLKLMENFSQGVQLNQDTIIEYRNNTLPTNDIHAGFVLGYTLEDNFRKKIIDQLKENKIPAVFVDSNILHYARQEHEWHRYSLNSVYPSKGTYFFSELDNTKWDRFSQWHNTNLKPWRIDGSHVLILCQRPKGWNMFGNDQDHWLDKTITKIRKYVDRPIRIRMHPGDGTKEKQIEKLLKRHGNSVEISRATNIKEDLVNCWCAVGYNSTPNVVAALEGVPVYVEDPKNSWAADVAFNDLSQISDPPMPDRSEWVQKIANIHWSNEEVQQGYLWSAIKTYILTSR